MKKFVCVLLCVLLCLPYTYAVPVSVSGVETVEEIAVNNTVNEETTAEIAQETEPVRTIFIEFEKAVSLGYTLQDVSEASISTGVLSFTAKKMDPRITFPVNFKADDYSSIKVRMKWDGVVREGVTPLTQIYYMGYDKDGNELKISESNAVKMNTSLSSDGEYKIVEFPLNASKLKGATITKLAFDPINTNGTLSLDYLMIVPKNDRPNMEWHFNTDGNAEGWSSNLTGTVISDGSLNGSTSATNNTVSKSVTKYKGSDYPTGYVRIKLDNMTADNAGFLFYTNLVNEAGTEIKGIHSEYTDSDGNKYKYPSAPSISKSQNGNWKVYTIGFGNYILYKNNYVTKFSLNINRTPADISYDYIILPHKNHFEWDFEAEGYVGGISISHPSRMIQEDGLIKFSSSRDEEYLNTMLTFSGVNLDANRWAGVEIVMKHDIYDTTNARVQMYYSGTAADGSEIKYSETNAVKRNVGADEASTGEGSVCYYLDFRSKSNWKGSTINNLRLDPLKCTGSYEIDYIRFVPMPGGVNEPLDESKMALTYEFEDTKPGTADGTIKIDFGTQSSNSAEKITLYWSSKNENGEYAVLDNYSLIKLIEGSVAEKGYKIDKNLVIPDEADAIIAYVQDCDKTFELVFDIPESKKAPDRGEPLYTVGLISDIHIGGWGSETAPNARLVAARTQLSALCDFVVVNGDLTQWYGAYSGEEFKAYNYNGTSYKDNGERSEEYLGIGNNLWPILTDYFKGFSVPVYAVQGNHDIKDSTNWSPMIESEKYWRPFMEEWVEYSNTAENGSKYENEAALYDDVNYYDTEVFGHHFIFTTVPKTQNPTYAFGDEQLKWLDMKLYEKEKTGKPIFVFGHVPLASNLNGSYWDTQVVDDAAIKEILAKHPTAIYVSGHTHYTLDVDYLGSIDGAQETTSYIHDGGTTTINVPNDEANPDETTEIQGSHGVVAKVYDDVILLCGRDFVNNRWISRGYTYLTLKEESNIADVEVKKALTDDEIVLTVNKAENTSVTWILDGTQSEVTADTITLSKDYDGYVAVRLTDENGNYTSDAFENVNDIPFENIVETQKAVSLRVGDNITTTGVRFASTITEANREIAQEYGYIVTRQTFLDAYDGELTFDFVTSDGRPLYVYGKNHQKNADGTVELDKIFELVPDGVKFVGVVTGLDMDDPTQVCEVLVVRPYAKIIKNGEVCYVYGETMTCSLQQIATHIRNNVPDIYEEHKEFIDKLADTTLE